jgi:hypothetical protein
VDAARGRIAFDFGGDACDGYTLKYRQVTVMEGGESGSRTLDVRTATYETADGKSIRFKSDSAVDNGGTTGTDGEARRGDDGSVSISLRQPRRETLTVEGDTIFPTEHTRRLIAAGRAGQTTLAIKLYDGSDDGKKVYDTLALIGRKIEPGSAPPAEEASKAGPLTSTARWPVTVSYFSAGSGDRTPAYTISFELYENGISRGLKLDYGDFALTGELKSVEVQPATTCRR